MKTQLFTSAAAAALLFGATAMASAECEVGGAEFEQHIAADPDARAGYSPRLVRDIRELRNAALTLSSYGRDDACEEVAAVIDEMVENPQDLERRVSGGEPMPVWSDNPARHSYQTAVSVGELDGRIRADDLIGSDVYGVNDETLGEISDIVFDRDGAPSYVVVGHGGFLGLGEEESAVPFERLKVSDDSEYFFLSLSAEQLDAAPRFERGSFDWANDEEWRRENDAYYSGADGNR